MSQYFLTLSIMVLMMKFLDEYSYKNMSDKLLLEMIYPV